MADGNTPKVFNNASCGAISRILQMSDSICFAFSLTIDADVIASTAFYRMFSFENERKHASTPNCFTGSSFNITLGSVSKGVKYVL